MEMPELKALLNQQKEVPYYYLCTEVVQSFLQKAIPILKRRVPFCHPLVTTVPSHSVNTTNQEAQISEDYFVCQIDLTTLLPLFSPTRHSVAFPDRISILPYQRIT